MHALIMISHPHCFIIRHQVQKWKQILNSLAPFGKENGALPLPESQTGRYGKSPKELPETSCEHTSDDDTWVHSLTDTKVQVH